MARAWLGIGLIGLLLLATTSYGDEATAARYQEQDHCDSPGHDLKSFKVSGREACAEACEKDAACQGYVFVSGWQRCMLKSSFEKTFKIQFHAGLVPEPGKYGARAASELRQDFDDSGKDLKRVTGLKSADQCGVACVAEVSCRAYVYIGGYDVCWLKKTSGKRSEKIFYCGQKVAPKAPEVSK